jgi:hypothetical protein
MVIEALSHNVIKYHKMLGILLTFARQFRDRIRGMPTEFGTRVLRRVIQTLLAVSHPQSPHLITHHGDFVRYHWERLPHYGRRHHRGALHRQDESRRGQNQGPEPAPANGILWRARSALSLLIRYPHFIQSIQVTLSSSQNTSSATSAYTRFETSTLSAHPQRHRGSAKPLQTPCVPESRIPSTCSSEATIPLHTTPISTGSTTSARCRRCRSLHTDTVPTLR